MRRPVLPLCSAENGSAPSLSGGRFYPFTEPFYPFTERFYPLTELFYPLTERFYPFTERRPVLWLR